eukprot:jgi/Mesvir1/21296/Mv21687-RA.1
MENDMEDVEDVDVEKLCSLLLNDSDDSPPGKHSRTQFHSANQGYFIPNSSENVLEPGYSAKNWDSKMRPAYSPSHWDFGDAAIPGMSPTATKLGFKTAYRSPLGESLPVASSVPIPAQVWSASDADSLLTGTLPVSSPQFAWPPGHDGRRGNSVLSPGAPVNPLVGTGRQVPGFLSPGDPAARTAGSSLAPITAGFGLGTASAHAKPGSEAAWTSHWSPEAPGHDPRAELPLNRPWDPVAVPLTAHGSGTFAMWPMSSPPADASIPRSTPTPLGAPGAERGMAPTPITAGGGKGTSAPAPLNPPSSLPARGRGAPGALSSIPGVPASSSPGMPAIATPQGMPTLASIRVSPHMGRPTGAVPAASTTQPAAGMGSMPAASKPSATKPTAAVVGGPAGHKAVMGASHPGAVPVVPRAASWHTREEHGAATAASVGPHHATMASAAAVPMPTTSSLSAAAAPFVVGAGVASSGARHAGAGAGAKKAGEVSQGRNADGVTRGGGGWSGTGAGGGAGASFTTTGGGAASKADVADKGRDVGQDKRGDVRQVKLSSSSASGPHIAQAMAAPTQSTVPQTQAMVPPPPATAGAAERSQEPSRDAQGGHSAGHEEGVTAAQSNPYFSRVGSDVSPRPRAEEDAGPSSGRGTRERGAGFGAMAAAPEGGSTSAHVSINAHLKLAAAPGTPGVATSPAGGIYGFYSCLNGADTLPGMEGSTKDGASSSEAGTGADNDSTNGGNVSGPSVSRWHPSTWRAPMRRVMLAAAWMLLPVLAYITWALTVGSRLASYLSPHCGGLPRHSAPYAAMGTGAVFLLVVLLLTREYATGRQPGGHASGSGIRKKPPLQPQQQAQGAKGAHPGGVGSSSGPHPVAQAERAPASGGGALASSNNNATQGADANGRKRRGGGKAAPPSSSSSAAVAGGSSHGGSSKGGKGSLGVARVAAASVTASGAPVPGPATSSSSSSLPGQGRGRSNSVSDASTSTPLYRQALHAALGTSPPLRVGGAGATSKQLLRLRRRSRSTCIGGILGVSLLALLGWVSLVAFEDGWRLWYERLTLAPQPAPIHHHHHHHHHRHSSSRGGGGGGGAAGGAPRPLSHHQGASARPKMERSPPTTGGSARPHLVGEAPHPTLVPSLGWTARTTTSSAPHDKDKGPYLSDDMLQMTLEGLMAASARGRGAGADPPLSALLDGPKRKGGGGGNGPLVRLQRCEDRCYGLCRDVHNPGRECVDACTERCVGPCGPRCVDGCMDRCWDGCVADCVNPCMGHCVERRDDQVEACMEACEAAGGAEDGACGDRYDEEGEDGDGCAPVDIHACVAQCDKEGVYVVCAGVCQEACEDRLGDECEAVCEYPCGTMCDDKCFHSCHADCLDRCPWDDCRDPCLLHCQEVFDAELGARGGLEPEGRPPVTAARADKPLSGGQGPAQGQGAEGKRKGAGAASGGGSGKGKDRRDERGDGDSRGSSGSKGSSGGGTGVAVSGGMPGGRLEATHKSGLGPQAGKHKDAPAMSWGGWKGMAESLLPALQWLVQRGYQGSLDTAAWLTGGRPRPHPPTADVPSSASSASSASDGMAPRRGDPLAGATGGGGGNGKDAAGVAAGGGVSGGNEEPVVATEDGSGRPVDGRGARLLSWAQAQGSWFLASARAWLRYALATVTAHARQWVAALSRRLRALLSATTDAVLMRMAEVPVVAGGAARSLGQRFGELTGGLLRGVKEFTVGALRATWSGLTAALRAVAVALPSYLSRQFVALILVTARWLQSLIATPFWLLAWAVAACYHTTYTILAALDMGLTAFTIPIMVAVAANTLDQLLLQSAARNHLGQLLGFLRRVLLRSPAYISLHSWLWSWLEEEEQAERKPSYRSSPRWRQGAASQVPPPPPRGQPRYRQWRDDQRQKEEAFQREREWRQQGGGGGQQGGARGRWREEIDASMGTKSETASEECARILAAGNHFAVLQVDISATASDVKKSWREKALMVHPDKNLQPSMLEDANEAFRKLQQAYVVLSDATHRAQYEQQLMSEGAPSVGYAGGGDGVFYGSDEEGEWEMDEEAFRFMEEILRQFSQGGQCGCANCKGQRARAASGRGGKKYGKKKQRSKGGRPW